MRGVGGVIGDEGVIGVIGVRGVSVLLISSVLGIGEEGGE